MEIKKMKFKIGDKVLIVKNDFVPNPVYDENIGKIGFVSKVREEKGDYPFLISSNIGKKCEHYYWCAEGELRMATKGEIALHKLRQ